MNFDPEVAPFYVATLEPALIDGVDEAWLAPVVEDVTETLDKRSVFGKLSCQQSLFE